MKLSEKLQSISAASRDADELYSFIKTLSHDPFFEDMRFEENARDHKSDPVANTQIFYLMAEMVIYSAEKSQPAVLQKFLDLPSFKALSADPSQQNDAIEILRYIRKGTKDECQLPLAVALSKVALGMQDKHKASSALEEAINKIGEQGQAVAFLNAIAADKTMLRPAGGNAASYRNAISVLIADYLQDDHARFIGYHEYVVPSTRDDFKGRDAFVAVCLPDSITSEEKIQLVKHDISYSIEEFDHDLRAHQQYHYDQIEKFRSMDMQDFIDDEVKQLNRKKAANKECRGTINLFFREAAKERHDSDPHFARELIRAARIIGKGRHDAAVAELTSAPG